MEIIADAEQVALGEYTTVGNWTFGQILTHLAQAMHCTFDGFARARFAGDTPVAAALVDGPTTDFYLIWRRDEWVATARNFDGVQEIGAGGGLNVIVGGYVVSGTATLLNGVSAHAGDTFLSEPGERLHLELDGSLVGFLFAPHAAGERGLTGLTVVPKQGG